MRSRLVLVFIFILLASCFLAYLIIYIAQSNKTKRILLQKLYDMKDLETLYKIGETNAFGEKERRRVPFFIVADYLDDRYVKTKNEVYNKIADLYIERSHKMLGCWLLFGMSSTIAFAIYNWPL